MRICISVVGTPGDVLPMLALATGLRSAGHKVRFATPALYREPVERAGVEFYEIEGRPDSFFSGRAGVALRTQVRQPASFQRFWNLCVGPYARRYLRQTWEAARDCETVVCIPWFHAAASLSTKLGVPCFASTVMPAIGIPSSHLRNPMEDWLTVPNHGGCRSSWKGSMRLASAPFEQVNEWRVLELGLKPLSHLGAIRAYRRTHFLLSYSQSVLPNPPDWPATVHVTGFWPFESQTEWTPPPEVARFLGEHPAPLLVGFSSQVASDPAAFTRKVVEGVRRSGRSAILLTGWGGLEQAEMPANILLQKAIPYEWIVPRLSGFLHHGGCGTTAACLRHGVPNMAIPFGFDQRLWGKRIHELGCGPAPLDPDTLDSEELCRSLLKMRDDPATRENCARVAATLHKEDGVANAVRTIEQVTGGGAVRPSQTEEE